MLQKQIHVEYYPQEINDACGLLTHHLGQIARSAGHELNRDCVMEIEDIVLKIYDAAVATAVAKAREKSD